MANERGELREKIEGMYQRAMNLRDSTPVHDLPAALKVESKYLDAYMKAYHKTRNIAAFKIATREYRRFLHESRRVS